MHMQVEDRLSGIGAGVDDQTIATFLQVLCLSQLASNGDEMAENRFIFWSGIIYRGNVAVGNQEDVHWSDRSSIPKGSDALILIKDGGWQAAGDDFTEDAGVGHRR